MSNEANPPDDSSQDGHSRRAVLQRSAGGFAFAGIGGVRMITAGNHDGPGTITESTTVDEPGRYVLDDDFTAAGDGIEIAASDVTIDGRGHRIEGDGRRAGVKIRDGARSVTVENLAVRNFRRGVDVGWDGSLSLSSVTVEGNAADGVRSDGEAEIACEGSTIRGNGGGGVAIYDGRVSIRDCEIRGNAERALVARSGGATAVVEDSVLRENGGGIRLPVTPGSGVERTLIEANGGPGLETTPVRRTSGTNDGPRREGAPGDRSPIEANGGPHLGTAPSDGPSLAEPVFVRHCDVRDNAGAGIDHTNGYLEVRGCTLAGNEVGYRLRAEDEFEGVLRHNVIEDNEEGGAVADPTPIRRSIDATCNWWGDETGPRHRDNPLEDPGGQSVSDRVRFLPWSTGRPDDTGRAATAGRPGDSDRLDDPNVPCVGGLETDDSGGALEAGESVVGYVSTKSYRRIVGADPYDAGCWDGTFYVTDPSDIDRDGFGGPGAILVGEGERLADGHVIRAEADAVPVTLPTWGGERGDCESVLFVELNRPLDADRAYRITAVHDPEPYREAVDTGGFAGVLADVVRVAFEPVEPDASIGGAGSLR